MAFFCGVNMKDVRTEYKEYIFRKKIYILILVLAIAGMVLIAINVGSSNMSFAESVRSLLGIGSEQGMRIVYKVRLPRVLGAIVVGIGLSLAGLVLQTILNNPLASPSTLGINSAAAFGANVGIIVLGIGTGTSNSDFGVGFFAFLFSIVSSIVIILLAKINEFSRHTILLAGVAIGSFFTALTTALQYFAEDVQIASAVFWTFGDLGRISYKEILILGIVTAISVVYTYLKALDLNVIEMGEVTAKSLGVDVKKLSIHMIVIASLITAVSVSYVGMIGFVGLISPQIVRRVMGTEKRFMIIGSLLLGAFILIVADTLARTLAAPVVLPVGAVTSFFGAPLFLYILLKEKKL